MSQIKLHEQVSDRIAPRESGGDKYAMRIISPGEGSSGHYPAGMLERDVPSAFPQGTRMRANHDGLCEDGGDMRRVIAKTIDVPWKESDGSMWATFQVSPQWNEYFQQFADVIGVSISAAGEYRTTTDEDGNETVMKDEASGKPIVAKLYSQEESPYNSIDFVEAPGANGRIMMAVEGAKTKFAELNVREQATFVKGTIKENSGKSRQEANGSPARGEKKEIIRMDDEMKEEFAAVNKRLDALSEALTPSSDPAEDTVDLVAVERAGVEAGLPAELRDEVVEAAKDGKDWNAVLESRSKLVASITESATKKLEQSFRSQGYIVDEGAEKGDKQTFADSGAFFEALDAELGLEVKGK